MPPSACKHYIRPPVSRCPARGNKMGNHRVSGMDGGYVNYRTLGRTGLEVSEIGYGAWGIAGDAWLGAKDEESLEALNRAVDLGLNFIDTALAYGEGHSERLVGKIVEERDETIHVATKIPPKNEVWPA